MNILLKLLSCSALFVLITCFLTYYFIFCRKITQWKKRNIPFLQPLFLIGHKYFLRRHNNSILVTLNRIYQENKDKDVLALFCAICPVILIKDPKLLKQIFVKNADKTFQTFFVLPDNDIDGQTLLAAASNKAQWKKGHTALMPLFSTTRMDRAAFDSFKRQIAKLNHYVEERRLGRQPINVETITFNFFADNLCLWHFGDDINSYEEYNELTEVIPNFFHMSPLKMTCFSLMTIFPPLYALRHVIKGFQIVDQKYVDLMKSLLKRKIEQRTKFGIKRDDLIDHLMSLRKKGFFKENKGDGVDTILGNTEERTLRQMTGYALTMLLGGIDTVSQLSLTVIHLLSLHPEYQEKIKQEIDDVMRKHQVSKLTLDVIQDLRLIEQCVYESVRLIPLLSIILRRCSEDFQIPGTNYTFKKNDIITAVPYSIHHDPKYYKDPDTFYPERFDLDDRSTTSWQYLMSFGLGSRKCPGYKLEVLEVIIFIASIVCKYEIRPRSNLTQMTAEDYHPRGAIFRPRRDLLVDFFLR